MEWTEDEMKAFDRLSLMTSSRDQVERIDARMKMAEFVSLHGKEKCDAMFADICSRFIK